MNIFYWSLLTLTLGTIASGYIKSDYLEVAFGWKTFKKNEPNCFTLGLTQNAYESEDGSEIVEHFVIGLFFIGLSFIFTKKVI